MQTIILVDDDRSILIAWKRILQLEGHRVETASDGKAGLAAANKVQPVLAVTDRRCPTESGRGCRMDQPPVHPHSRGG
ncbi:response regulator [Paraburkholderia sp. MPAMCS5]|uniref:response regulator n=1 Tax=Paraburkholderia sp. MPAMCS5 TaxID=3112563 RepID=UPI002E174CD9|nr:response regulator [Paraburkholderia sp. MPAMCS5]